MYCPTQNYALFTTFLFLLSLSTIQRCAHALTELPAVTGVNEVNNELNAAISISPNPNNGHFTIDLKDIKADVKSIGLYNNIGQLMQQLQVNKSEIITVSTNYPSGIYFIQVITDKGIAAKKVVID